MSGDALLQNSISSLPYLTTHTINALRRYEGLPGGIWTVGDLVACSETEMACIYGFGRKSMNEVREGLRTIGIWFRGREGGDSVRWRTL